MRRTVTHVTVPVNLGAGVTLKGNGFKSKAGSYKLYENFLKPWGGSTLFKPIKPRPILDAEGVIGLNRFNSKKVWKVLFSTFLI